MPFFDIENYLNYQRFTQLISKYIQIKKLEIMESVHGFFVNNVRKLKKNNMNLDFCFLKGLKA